MPKGGFAKRERPRGCTTHLLPSRHLPTQDCRTPGFVSFQTLRWRIRYGFRPIQNALRKNRLKLEDLTPDVAVAGIAPGAAVTVLNVRWHGADALTLTYREPTGGIAEEVLYRQDEGRLRLAEQSSSWRFDGDGATYRLVAEALRIRLAHLFDPLLAVHTSLVEPLPHQITAVYEAMLPRQPLRFLLADDPGAGKTIMAGLLMKELIVRGDLRRCLVVCPGSLAEQWQDELRSRFHLPFEILTSEGVRSAASGNWFAERDFVIARLDKLARDEELQALLAAPDCRFDLVVCDEAHKMSAHFFRGEVSFTKRYRLGQLLSGITRHFLLMTATPHNGKEEDFQLFLALLDPDRFEGRFRDGTHQVDTSDLMRRMVKEALLKFDGAPLFPERIAHSVPYRLSAAESRLYEAVTSYVRQEFNRADALQNDGRAGAVGFALTILQRRLASSPEAIHQSLRRRRERLQERLRETRDAASLATAPALEIDLDDLDEAPEAEVEAAETAVMDAATAASTVAELQAEIAMLEALQALAADLRQSGEDAKWRELTGLLDTVFARPTVSEVADTRTPYHGSGTIPPPSPSPRQKLVVFTEHRDTLTYLQRRTATLLGNESAVAVIHGGMARNDRRSAQDAFLNDPQVRVLLATDAAGEGINLQRAHLMVNYDLPWNPNRLEQRFGRIHRIGQTEVCHLWNLVAADTREGDVYRTLLDKLEQARFSLGGQVFDVLGKLQFAGRSLRDLLVEAIRYGDREDVRARLENAVTDAVDKPHLQTLIEERALAHDAMDSSRVAHVREDMERAEARRLQPHYIESFFLAAFERLGGTLRQREPTRYEITHVPAAVRQREPSLPRRYERIAFDKAQINVPGRTPAAFVSPGHPLLAIVLALTLEQGRETLRQGAVLVDERDFGVRPRVLVTLQHSVRDGERVISERLLNMETDDGDEWCPQHHAPHLDYRPLADEDPTATDILARAECAWIGPTLRQQAESEAIAHLVPDHTAEVRERRGAWIQKTRAAVQDRLTKEITHWDARANELKRQEQAGNAGARLNSGEARRRADDLQVRLRERLTELDREEHVSALPPKVVGCLVIAPLGLIRAMQGAEPPLRPTDTQEIAARARAVVMATERALGFDPTDREFEHLGYDIESRDPATGKLRFIEVKGRAADADSITVTRNEVLTALNKPADFILAIVRFDEAGREELRYLREPFTREPDFGAVSVTYRLEELWGRGEGPR